MVSGNGGNGGGSGSGSNSTSRPSAFDGIARDVAMILRPILAESLYPQKFTGDVSLAVHFDDGNVRHIRAIDLGKKKPGEIPAAAVVVETNKSPDIDYVLNSAIADLRNKISTIAAGFFGAVTLTIQIEYGICTLITLGSERFIRQTR